MGQEKWRNIRKQDKGCWQTHYVEFMVQLGCEMSLRGSPRFCALYRDCGIIGKQKLDGANGLYGDRA